MGDIRINESCFEKFRIPWGMSSIVHPLTEDDIETLKRRLEAKGSTGNIISANFTFPEVKWMEDNLDNAFIQRITDDTEDGSVWTVIGPDKETVVNYVSKI